MRYFKLVFMSFDGEFYNMETEWIFKSDLSDIELQEYIYELNEKKGENSFFFFNEINVLDELPDCDTIINDLEEL